MLFIVSIKKTLTVVGGIGEIVRERACILIILAQDVISGLPEPDGTPAGFIRLCGSSAIAELSVLLF